MEKWSENNASPEETKYDDLITRLKKNNNEKLKNYVNKTLIERMRDMKEVKKVLDILEEKYAKTKCERIKEIEQRWSDFKAGENVDIFIDKYEEIVTEMETLGLVTEMRRYAMNAMFIDKLEESGKIKAMEKLRLKDIVQSADGEK